MADIAWVRKYRPRTFDEYMGNNVKNLIVNRFKDRNNIPNTIMLYGTRGTGKTSMARLMCKEILCLSPVDGHSCGHCELCQEIDRYITSTEAGEECFGITEVDAATTTGKNDINDIIEDALIAPMYPLTKKVIILDECHMLSKAAQNSLLKVIEEPPSHLVFILCTTDPNMVIPTIHSRIQLKLEVKKKSVEELSKKLLEISEKENLHTSMEALRIIAKKGDRVPREAINLLETVAKNYGGEVTVDTVRASIGDVASEIYLDYFKAANTSLEDILVFNTKLKDKDISPKQFISGLIRFMLDACYVKHGINLDDYPVEFLKQVKGVFSIYRSSEFDALLQVIEDASRSVGDDDTKGELIVTTTAMRIGKIGILAQGLGEEVTAAEDENKKSIVKFKEAYESDVSKQFEKIKDTSPTKEALSQVFSGLTEVKDTSGKGGSGVAGLAGLAGMASMAGGSPNPAQEIALTQDGAKATDTNNKNTEDIKTISLERLKSLMGE